MTLRVALDVTPLLGRPTGVGVFVQGLIDALKPCPEPEIAGFALSLRGFSRVAGVLPPGARHNHLPMPAGPLTGLWAVTRFPPLGLWLRHVNVVHGTNFVVPPSKAGSVVTVHDLTAIRFPKMCEGPTLQYPDLVKVAVRRGSHVHTLSHAMAREVEELLGVDADRIHVIPPGIRPVQQTGSGEGAKLVGADQYILAIGTVEPRKDYPTLVRAFDSLAGERPDLHLVIAGDSGWGAAEFNSAMQVAKHRSRIRHLGRVDERQRAALLREATVLAYPSIYEGFGFPPLEAMDVGVPVVATAAGSLPETVGKAGLLVTPRDPTALREQLALVLDDESLRADLAAAGKKRVASFDWAESAAQFVKLYEELAA